MSEFFERIGLAFKCFFLVLFAGRLPDGIPRRYFRPADETAPPASAGSPGATDFGGARRAPAPDEPVLRAESRAAGESPGAGLGVAGQAGPDRAVQLLALFQRDGRLVDFLSEDIAGYPDDQVGAAVREVHQSCRDVLQKYVSLEPVMAGEEGRPTTVEPGFDVACVKLVGTVTGKPPFRGILRHKGWRARRVDLPVIPGDGGRNVIAPAEVEIG